MDSELLLIFNITNFIQIIYNQVKKELSLILLSKKITVKAVTTK